VFDYRQIHDDSAGDTLWRCAPWHADRRCAYELAMYFLSPAACTVLEPWTLWRTQQRWDQMIVPHVEAGHPGAIPLASIDEVLRVSIS
jgi:hypothetical protein